MAKMPKTEQAVGGHDPALSSPEGAEAPCAAEQTGTYLNVAAVSHGQHVPTPTAACSRLTRQHGGEESGLVNLTFDLESGVRVTCDAGYLCANFGLPMPLRSRFRPDVRDRRQTRQMPDRRTYRSTSDSIIACSRLLGARA